MKTGSVLQKIDKQLANEIKRNRKAVETLLRVVILCGKQDIALQGHSENVYSGNRGNFREILELIRLESTKTNTIFSKLPKNANYLSHESQNELLSAVAGAITHSIVQDIRDSGMFSIIADEARDVSCSEQMSICFRYVKNTSINERFLKFVNVHQLDAASLSLELISTMRALGLNLTLRKSVLRWSCGYVRSTTRRSNARSSRM